jgi:hypothetical protein
MAANGSFNYPAIPQSVDEWMNGLTVRPASFGLFLLFSRPREPLNPSIHAG